MARDTICFHCIKKSFFQTKTVGSYIHTRATAHVCMYMHTHATAHVYRSEDNLWGVGYVHCVDSGGQIRVGRFGREHPSPRGQGSSPGCANCMCLWDRM